jgi:hypothetical protein
MPSVPQTDFAFTSPATITFSSPSESQSLLTLESIRVVFQADHDGKQIEIGTTSYDGMFFSRMQNTPLLFSWDWTIHAFAFYERLRAGKEPRFLLRVCGDIRYVLVPEGCSASGRDPISVANTFSRSGEVSYSPKAWTTMMRNLKIQDSIIVEIPMPSDPPTGWEPIWMTLRDARDSFDSGGSTGWKNTATSVRLALEEWRKIEAEDKGPTDPHQRTKAQRTDNIRWHLIQLAHYAAHTKADEWTRDDALLMLSTVCALLNVRNP